jgi:hypothetical protein
MEAESRLNEMGLQPDSRSRDCAPATKWALSRPFRVIHKLHGLLRAARPAIVVGGARFRLRVRGAGDCSLRRGSLHPGCNGRHPLRLPFYRGLDGGAYRGCWSGAPDKGRRFRRSGSSSLREQYLRARCPTKGPATGQLRTRHYGPAIRAATG